MDQERIDAVMVSENTMLGDLMKCVIAELKVMPKAWEAMSKSAQDDAIERIEKQMREAADQAINIIACRNMPSVQGTVDSVTFKGGAKAVIKFGSITEGVHQLADAEGHFINITIPEVEDLVNESGMPEGEDDQRGLDLGHEYNEKHDGEPFVEADHSEAEEQLGDALADAEEADPDASEE